MDRQDRLGTYQSLDEAKDAAEQAAGNLLRWRWREDRRVWRAEIGYQQAAEISEGALVERVSVRVGIIT